MGNFGFPYVFVVLIGFFYVGIIVLIIIFAWRLLKAVESIANSILKMVELKQQQ